jgi:hypothetical protein
MFCVGFEEISTAALATVAESTERVAVNATPQSVEHCRYLDGMVSPPYLAAKTLLPTSQA